MSAFTSKNTTKPTKTVSRSAKGASANRSQPTRNYSAAQTVKPARAADSMRSSKNLPGSTSQRSSRVISLPQSPDESRPTTPTAYVSIGDIFHNALEVMGVEHRWYMWAVRPLFLLASLAFWVFFIGTFAWLFHIVWWSDNATMEQQSFSWLLYTLTFFIFGVIASILAMPKDDTAFIWRILSGFFLLIGGLALAIVRTQDFPIDTILNLWFVNGEYAFTWLPVCVLMCGGAWILLNLAAIIVKMYFWTRIKPNLGS